MWGKCIGPSKQTIIQTIHVFIGKEWGSLQHDSPSPIGIRGSLVIQKVLLIFVIRELVNYANEQAHGG